MSHGVSGQIDGGGGELYTIVGGENPGDGGGGELYTIGGGDDGIGQGKDSGGCGGIGGGQVIGAAGGGGVCSQPQSTEAALCAGGGGGVQDGSTNLSFATQIAIKKIISRVKEDSYKLPAIILRQKSTRKKRLMQKRFNLYRHIYIKVQFVS